MNTGILIEGAVGVGFTTIRDILAIFARPPMVYFVAAALVGGVIGVAKIFVPMRKR